MVGYGLIGPAHVRSVLSNEHTELSALVDLNPAVIAEAQKLGVPYYANVQDLLSSTTSVDAAIICTPNHTHADTARVLSRAGVHLLIEKPLCPDTEDGALLAAELKAADDERGVKSLVGHHRRFNPYTIAVKKALDGGSLGSIIAVNALWTLQKPPVYFEATWRQQVTAGPVLINLIHDVDLFHHFFGPITRIHTERAVSRRGFAAEEGAAIIFRFLSGIIATVLISDNVPAPYAFEMGTAENPTIHATGQDCYRIMGSEATLSVPDMTRWSYDGREQKDWGGPMTRETLEVSPGIPFDRQLTHFIRFIRGEEKASCTPQAGLAAVVVCEAVKQSLELGEAVTLEPYEL